MAPKTFYSFLLFISITCITFAVVSIVGNGFFSAQPQWMVPSHKQKWKSSFSTVKIVNLSRKNQRMVHSSRQKWDPWFHAVNIANLTGNKWVWKSGLKYNHTCSISKKSRARCCGKNPKHKNLHLSPSGPSLDKTVETFIRKTHSKYVVFLGDSLLFQLFWGFQDALNLEFFDPYPKKCELCDCALQHPCEGRNEDSSLKIKMIVTWKFAHPNCSGVRRERCVLFNEIRSLLKTSNIVIFQTGIHYNYAKKEFYVSILTKLGKIAQEEMIKGPGKQVILRSTLPQHFQGKGGWHQPRTKGKGCKKISSYKEHWTNEYLKKTAEHYGLKYMDSAPFYVDRWDLHMRPIDCTHSCITPEVTIPEMALLNSLLE